MFKKIQVLLILLTLCLSLAGCQNKKDLKEVQAIYDNLYPDIIKAIQLVYADELELGQEVTDENGNSYRMIDDSDYQTLEDVEQVLRAAFNEDFISGDLWDVFEGDEPVFKEIDGKLCFAVKSIMDEDVSGSKKVTAVNKKEEDYIVFETKLCGRKCELTIIKDNEKWVVYYLSVLKDYR